jgi:S1-C subfamily serine protease
MSNLDSAPRLHVGSAQGVGQPVRVHAVDPDSVAAKAFPKIEPGDVITTINKKFVLGLEASHQDITALMRKSKTLELTLIEGPGFDQVKLASISKESGTPAGLLLSTGGDHPDTGYVHRVHKVRG